jgi:hypothetical protein
MADDFPAPDVATIANAARQLLRDFPAFFSLNIPANVRKTVELPHPLVVTVDVWDIANDTEVPSGSYNLNNRSGVVQFPDRSAYTSGLQIQGFYYEWFLPEDLNFYAEFVVHDQLFERETSVNDFSDISQVEKDVMAKGTVVLGLMSLLSEFSTQIDVSSPEGMSIPAHQRYTQVQSMYQMWDKQYEEDCANLNVGLDRISMRTLRRVSRMTNRLVPLFEEQEIDDPRPPMRVFPPIPPISPDDQTDPSGDAGSMGDWGLTGWETLGTSGG